MATAKGEVHQRSSEPVYEELHDDPDFIELKKRYLAFCVPWTVAFLAWYLLYVVMSNWASGFMNHKLFGNINVALVFGVLQFVSTFAIAFIYSRHAGRQLDPLADGLRQKYDDQLAEGKVE